MHKKGLVFIVFMIAILILAYIYIGYLIGTGYTLEVRFFVSSRPSKLSISNFSSPEIHPAMLISGLAYDKVKINASSVMRFYSPPHVEGNVTCRIVAGENYYECTGEGYVYVFRGRELEIITNNNVSRYYYGGPALGTSGTYVILYGYGFADTISKYFTPLFSAVVAYLTLRYLPRVVKREHVKFTYVLIALISMILMYVGLIEGFNQIPQEISILKIYLLNAYIISCMLLSIVFVILYIIVNVILTRHSTHELLMH